MLKIRLQRVGRKHDPTFRVVLTDHHNAAKKGRSIELLGFHDPRKDRSEIKAERVKHWIAHGAQVSDTVHNLLITKKIIEGKKINVLPRKSPPAKAAEVPQEAASAQAPAETTPAEATTE